MTNVVSDFKKFVNKGNIFDMAIGVIIGAAFTAMLNSLVNDILMPLISRALNFDITSAKVILKEAIIDPITEDVIKDAIILYYGRFFQATINFLIIAISIFLAIKIVKRVKNGYIKAQIKYIKKLKEAHPELFDEEDELGTKLYESMKKKYPQYFDTEEAEEIEEATPDPTPDEITNSLLESINNNLIQLNLAMNPNYIDKSELQANQIMDNTDIIENNKEE